jgi:hypothetical protein
MEKQFFVYDEVSYRYTGQYFSVEKTLMNSTEIAPINDFCEWNGIEWIDPRTEEDILKALVPEMVTKLQLKLQLTLSGFDLALIDNAINQLPEPQRSLTSISWNDATLFERNNQLLISLATQLGLTSLDLDNIFISASNI